MSSAQHIVAKDEMKRIDVSLFMSIEISSVCIDFRFLYVRYCACVSTLEIRVVEKLSTEASN